MEEEGSMEVDGEQVDAEIQSDPENDTSSDDDDKEQELNRKKEALQQRVCISILIEDVVLMNL